MEFLAYIDPGSGSALFQLLIAGALGAIYYVRESIFNIFFRLRSMFKNEE